MQHLATVMRLAMVMHPITPLLQPHTPLGTGVIHTSNITHMCLIAQPHGDRYSSKQPRSTNHTSSGAGRIARSKRETERFGRLAQTDVLSMDQQWWKSGFKPLVVRARQRPRAARWSGT